MIFTMLAEEMNVECWTFHIINKFNYDNQMLEKCFRNCFANKRGFVNHAIPGIAFRGEQIQSLRQ